MKKLHLSPLPFSAFRRAICMLSVFAVTLALMLTGLSRAGSSVSSSGTQAAEDAVRRAALCCYALEGTYPESYDYLKEHYPIGISETLYVVHYTASAPSLMPEVTVVRRGSEP